MPVAASAPVANNSESPGRKGVMTNPVSAKTIRNSSPYTHDPYICTKSRRCASKCSTKSIIESLLQIVVQVRDILDAGGDADEAVGEANLLAPLGRDRRVRHRRRMADEGLDAAEAFGERHEPHAIADAARHFERADVERQHAAESAHLPFRQNVLRIAPAAF